ncbi:acyltransferase family protein [Isoptericola halotolerans]|uniref:Peptidoglycan/LPS O-acetylase OafA/YrhL n=1 Tax=Isoptericola halotolerans TaxID=300560 RepID=A0ABX2A5H6_9MICO|nr:peptidoglycan/LPS O-acetylase OafA/YrhL [Isoptericola halotolerans]
MRPIRQAAARTPASRRRDLDLLRAAAICAVVVGHWLLMTVGRTHDGHLTGFTALPQLAWAHGLTWLFQVMPVFFLVGGAVSAISWTHQRDRGETATAWLLDRSARLFPPLTVFLLVVAAGAGVARLAHAPPDVVEQAVALVILPLWFLVVYLGVTALTPLTYRLHERYGLAVPVVLVAGVAAGDLLRFTTGHELAGAGSFVFGWLAVHHAGYAWHDGTLALGPRRAALIVVAGMAALVLLTVPGPYPVSMVTVPGAAMQNPAPPTLALLALATTQLGVVALLSRPARQWLARPGPWTAVVAVNTVVLTVYLWHLVAALLGALALDTLGWLPPSDPSTTAWWSGRVPWLAALAVVLAVLVMLLAPIENRASARRRPGVPTDGHRTRRAAAAARLARTGPVVGAYAATVGGLLWLTVAGTGRHGPLVLPTGALVMVLAGATVLHLARAAGCRSTAQ